MNVNNNLILHRPPQTYSAIEPHKCPDGWIEVDTKFITLCATNVAWISGDICISPRAKYYSFNYIHFA